MQITDVDENNEQILKLWNGNKVTYLNTDPFMMVMITTGKITLWNF